MESKMTAVEWLIDKLSNIKAEDFNSILEVRLICQQAKEMEKEQIEESFKHGRLPVLFGSFEAEEYYNEKYK